jgi:Uma2 family endonuclease
MSKTAELAVLPQVVLMETDGEPLETPWHLAAIVLLIDVVRYHLRGRTDFFVGGNMFLYFSEAQVRNRDYKGPDFFFVKDVDGLKPREWWAVWQEDGRYPDFIMELISPTTARVDRTTKKKLYARTFRTPEYLCYDPTMHQLEGWRLNARGRYKAIEPNEQGWLWSEQLQLWIGLWKGEYLDQKGTWPRLFNTDSSLVPTLAEAEKQRGDAEKLRGDAERERAERAEAELAQLRARLAKSEGEPPAQAP